MRTIAEKMEVGKKLRVKGLVANYSKVTDEIIRASLEKLVIAHMKPSEDLILFRGKDSRAI